MPANTADFQIWITPPAAPIPAGQSAVYSVTVNPVNSLDPGTQVTLSFSNMPAGAAATPNTFTVAADGALHNFSVATTTGTPSGQFFVTGSGGGHNHSVWATLTTQSTPSGTYTLSGQIQQPNGIDMGAAVLTVRDLQNSLVTSVTSDSAGNYSIPLSLGQYTVTASSPYGIFAPASKVYTLTSHLPGQNRKVMTMNLAPPEELPYEVARNYYDIGRNGIPQTKSFWFENLGDNARHVTSCRVNPATNITAQFNYPTDADVTAHGQEYFTITFTAQPSANLGQRDVICNFKGQDIVGITGINVISIKWGGNVYRGLMKASTAVGRWSDDTYSQDGTISAGITDPDGIITWTYQPGTGVTRQDPVLYVLHSSPNVAVATPQIQYAQLLYSPPVAHAKIHVEAVPPELIFQDQDVYFDDIGHATTGSFVSTSTISTVHNQEYTLKWFIKLDSDQDFPEQPFATSIQRMFVAYAQPLKVTIGTTQQGTATAKRIDYFTRAAEGRASLTGSPTNYGITESVVRMVSGPFGVPFGFGINGDQIGDQRVFWALLDVSPIVPTDCVGLAGLAAFVLAQGGIGATYDWAFPPLAPPSMPVMTDATIQSFYPLPTQYQDHPGISYNYKVVYYAPQPPPNPPLPNQLEGFFYVNDGGINKAFTVGPAAGPILPTTCDTIRAVNNNNNKDLRL